MIGKLICMWKGHAWRRARKGENAALKHCLRCPATVLVKRRAPRTPRPAT